MKTLSVPLVLVMIVTSASPAPATEAFDSPGRGYREQVERVSPSVQGRSGIEWGTAILPTLKWQRLESTKGPEAFRYEVTPGVSPEPVFGKPTRASRYEEAFSRPIRIFGSPAWPGFDLSILDSFQRELSK
jgi:hypothetical protein